MSNYNRNELWPEWEPIPWNATGPQVNKQEKGFHQRALKPLVWNKVDWNNFPEAGIFGHDRDWYVSRDIAYATVFENEYLLLIDNPYSGWPNPPRWGLASCPVVSKKESWELWGHFSDLPTAWVFPDTV